MTKGGTLFKRISVFASLIVVLLGVLAVQASADPGKPFTPVAANAGKPGPGKDQDWKPVTFRFSQANTLSGGPDIYCTTFPAPRPQLSNVPGGKTIHWGAKMICTVAGTLDLSAYLVEYVNTYPYTVQNAHPAPITGFDHIAWGIYPCSGYDVNGWEVYFTPRWNGIYGTPIEASSGVYWLGCD
jgi:hypothetical protein